MSEIFKTKKCIFVDKNKFKIENYLRSEIISNKEPLYYRSYIDENLPHEVIVEAKKKHEHELAVEYFKKHVKKITVRNRGGR